MQGAASIFATTSTSITVNPSLPARTVQELTDHIKANPGKLSYGHDPIQSNRIMV